ncbi:hypothetical protein [Xanthomarina sp.]|uniref:hypothetical protein n=1 Tax=Xanthomarina sp. TaxID=1931211 RepID=UPI002C19AD2E|nr:hypothetical protein [Xanthomarina sp.]HLV40508.1 hypothetical protein [Xanthomarina sp.]
MEIIKIHKYKHIVTPLACLFYFFVNAQEYRFTPLYKIQVNFHKTAGLEVGLIAFNYTANKTNFLEASISTEGILTSEFLLNPKINLEGGITFRDNGLLMIVGGTNVGIPTSLIKTNFLVSPKIGLSYGTFIRLYYSYNIFIKDTFQNKISSHQMSLEINSAAFHSFKLGF